MTRAVKRRTLAVVTVSASILAGGLWLHARLTSPPTGPVTIWPSRSRGFVQYMGSDDQVGYLVISELGEEQVSIASSSSFGMGVHDHRVRIQPYSGEPREFDLDHRPRLIIVSSHGVVCAEPVPISPNELQRFEQSLKASADEEGTSRAASVALASDLVTSLQE